MPPRGFSRRKALVIGGGSAVAVALAAAGREILFDPVSNKKASPKRSNHHEHADAAAETTAPPATEAPPPAPSLWSDPATWGGAVPGASDVAVVDKAVMLDVDTQVAGVKILPTGLLSYDPNVSHTLSSSGNVHVEGKLSMRPSGPAVQHLLAFVGIDEGRFVGDHTETPLDSDVGVWVTGAGVLDLVGTSKTAWTHLAAEANSGASTITVDDASGWQAGDEIVVTPTEQGDSTDHPHWKHHDRRVITSVSGNQVSLDKALDFSHPFVTVRSGVTHAAEVLNLGRNVRIEGTEGGRTHVQFLHAGAPQTLGWFALRHVGPRKGDKGVLGRYALHFHMCNDAVRGSTVTGGVVADSGNHAFVAHLSNGVNFTDCVVHDNVDDAFWWDLSPITATPDAVPSNDITYERCVASYIKLGDSPHVVAGFQITAGFGNVARGCVAVGCDGNAVSSAGFIWQKHSSSRDSWVFEDNICHNCKYGGIYYWQNNTGKTMVDRFTAYHNGIGILAGSYINSVSYRDCTLYACYILGLKISAISSFDEAAGSGITYEGVYIDQQGMSDYAVEIMNPSVQNSRRVTYVSGCTFKGGNVGQVGVEGGDGLYPQMYEFRDCKYEGNAFWLTDAVRSDSEIRVADGVNGSVLLKARNTGGNLKSEWNASVSPA
jgi:hypothetical protein